MPVLPVLPELVWRCEEGEDLEPEADEWGFRCEYERVEWREACSDRVGSRGWITVGDYNVNNIKCQLVCYILTICIKKKVGEELGYAQHQTSPF